MTEVWRIDGGEGEGSDYPSLARARGGEGSLPLAGLSPLLIFYVCLSIFTCKIGLVRVRRGSELALPRDFNFPC